MKSSLRKPVFDTNAVPASYGDANTRLTQRSTGAPAAASAGVMSVHVAPASRVSCTLPSSVPTQMTPAVTGDSDSVEIVQYGVLGKPIFDLSLVVRSGLIASQ